MSNQRFTKRALLTSLLTLVICFAMLLGTTFAWFTDSVSSGNNVIQTGNLDIEVQYTLDGENWADLDGATNLFQKGAWEPGHTEVVALKIENKGSLALKYCANMDIVKEVVGKTATDADIKLSEMLQVSTLNQAANNIGEISVMLAFMKPNGVLYENTAAFNASNILKADQQLLANDAHYLIIKVDMAETIGNEANHKAGFAPSIEFGINIVATQFTSENDSFGSDYDKDAVYPVANVGELQDAIENAVDGDVIQFTSDIKGDINIPQADKNAEFVIDGNGNTLEGSVLVDGGSATNLNAGVTIKNVKFISAEGDACINLGDGTNGTRYTCNVTIEGCTFAAPDKVGIKSYTGGDKNLTIKDCVATAEAHSLAQLAGVDNLVIENCEINSVRGVNLNNCTNVTIVGCEFNVQKYAVRFGTTSDPVAATNYLIKDCSVKSATVEDATIVLRKSAANATLTIENSTIEGNPKLINEAGATVVEK